MSRHREPLRVVLSHVYAWPEVRRGAERYVHELAASLARAGHAVNIIATAPTRHRGEELGVPVRYLKRTQRLARWYGPLADQVAFGAQALAVVAASRCDIWHAVSTADGAGAAYLSRVRPGLRSIYTEAGLPARWYRSTRPDHWIFESVVKHIDEFMCLTPAASQMLREDYGRESYPVGGGVDLNRFAGSAPKHPKPALLFPGSLSEKRKNVGLFLEACDLLLRDGHDIEAWLVGPGEVPEDASEAARAGLRAASVHRTADSAELPDLYRRAWVTVLPSDNEVFGLVVLESFASGTPAVVLDNGHGPAQLVTPAVGVRCERDARSLADACLAAIELSRSPETEARCRAVAAGYDWDTAITPRVLEIYRG